MACQAVAPVCRHGEVGDKRRRPSISDKSIESGRVQVQNWDLPTELDHWRIYPIAHDERTAEDLGRLGQLKIAMLRVEQALYGAEAAIVSEGIAQVIDDAPLCC